MNNTTLNEPAFPTGTYEYDGDGNILQYQNNGMTLRDYFAAKAMQGLIQDHTQSNEKYYESCANTSYAMADAMLTARQPLKD
jgi:hypothetical protein